MFSVCAAPQGCVNPPETPHGVLPLPTGTFLVPGMRFFPTSMDVPLILSFTDPLAAPQEPDRKQSRGFLPRHPAGTGAAAEPPGSVINAEFVSRMCYTGIPFSLSLHGTIGMLQG